ncbi:MAG: response regulator [Sphingomonadaceae bacterium]
MAMSTANAQGKIRVVIVEDESLYRDLLSFALAQHPRLEVVGSFADGESAVSAVSRLRPDVAMLDIELGGAMNGIQLGLLLRQQLPDLGIVILSNHQDTQFLAAVPQASVAGWSYLLKKSVSDLQALGRAIEGAAAGFVVLDPRLVTGARRGGQSPLSHLTPRQQEILSLIAQGFTNSAIAERLSLAEKTVENQINLLYQQLGIDREDPSLQPRVKATLICLQAAQPRQEWERIPPR